MITITRKMDLNCLRHVEPLQVQLFEGEVAAHTFVITPGEGVDFTGVTPTAFFVRSDQQRVDLTGTLADGNLQVTLTANCYAVAGRYKLTIYAVTEAQTVAVYACCGTVVGTRGSETAGDTEPIVEPAEVDLTPITDRLTALENASTATADEARFLAARLNAMETSPSIYMQSDSFQNPVLLFDQCDSVDRIYDACVNSTAINLYAIRDGQQYLHVASPTVEAFDLLRHKRTSSGYSWKTYVQIVDEETGTVTTEESTFSYMFPQPNYIIWLTGIKANYAVCIAHSNSTFYPKKNHMWIANMEA